MGEWLTDFLSRISDGINSVFGPILRPVFHPINDALDTIPAASEDTVSKVAALTLFFGAMAWVWFGLRREYVNLDAPTQKPWHDLRFWTVVFLAPHVLVYLYF
jgi:hypothetical protein